MNNLGNALSFRHHYSTNETTPETLSTYPTVEQSLKSLQTHFRIWAPQDHTHGRP